jgi:hypothetical protein
LKYLLSVRQSILTLLNRLKTNLIANLATPANMIQKMKPKAAKEEQEPQNASKGHK